MSTQIALAQETQLSLPLGFFRPIAEKTVTPFDKVVNDEVVWTEADIKALRESFLKHHLWILADGRARAQITQETMEWIMSDDIHPFSFVICCKSCGYEALDIREEVQIIMNKLH